MTTAIISYSHFQYNKGKKKNATVVRSKTTNMYKWKTKKNETSESWNKAFQMKVLERFELKKSNCEHEMT